jgi:hypothetical protein
MSKMMTTTRFSVLYIAEVLLPCLQTGDSPIVVINKANLESSLSNPKNLECYTDASLARQLSGLGYSIAKNHSLSDGNKRVALIMLYIYYMEKSKGVTLCKHWPKESDFTWEDIKTILEEPNSKEDMNYLAMVAANEITEEDFTKYWEKRLSMYQG